MELSLSLSLYRVFIINIAYLIDCLILIKRNTIIMTDYVSIVRNADIFTKSYKSNISESQKSAFLKYRHMGNRDCVWNTKESVAVRKFYRYKTYSVITRYIQHHISEQFSRRYHIRRRAWTGSEGNKHKMMINWIIRCPCPCCPVTGNRRSVF